MICQFLLDTVHRLKRYIIAFQQFRWTVRTVQHEHGFAACRYNVNMGRTVIIQIDAYPDTIEAKDSRHLGLLTQLLGFFK